MKAISIPFQIDQYGKVATSTDPRRVWAGRVKSVMGTPTGQRVMRSSFGSELPNNLFSTSLSVPGYVDSVVRAAATRWLPDLEVIDVVVGADPESADVSVEVVYTIPESLLDQDVQSVRIV